MIESFARNESSLELKEGQYIISVKEDSAEQLSAILLDDEYFELIKNNLVKSESGIPLINAVANNCLKARAYRELFERRKAGDKTADEKAIQKHLKDIWRLGAILGGDESVKLAGMPAKDIGGAIGKLSALPEGQFKQVVTAPGTNMKLIMDNLKKVFAVA